jgi:hypothetical protein
MALCKYKAFFNNHTTIIEAEGLYPAKVAAIAHFKPRKKQEHMVSVVLIEHEGKPVALNNSNADFG